MEPEHAADILQRSKNTTVQNIWPILDEKDTLGVFSRTEVDILLDRICT